MGNPILRDDGIGFTIIQELQNIIADPFVTLHATNLSGFPLMEMMDGFHYLIIVDAILTGGTPGTVYHLTPDDFASGDGAIVSRHKLGVLEALDLGRSLELTMPSRVDIIAVEAKDVADFGEGLTPEVARAVPSAVAKIRELLKPVLTQV